MRIEYGFYWMDEHFQDGIEFIDDFKFTGKTRKVNRDLEVEIVLPYEVGFFRKRIERRPTWVSADSFRVTV